MSSIKIKRDPARAKPIINEYECRLSQLFKDYRVRAGKILETANTMSLNHDALTNDLRTAATQILPAGNNIVSDMTLKAYKHGQTYADLQLKHAGIDPNRKLSIRPKKLAIGISFDMRPDQAIFDILLKKSLSNLKGITDDMSKRITQELADGILKGEGMDKLARRLNDSVDTIGITRSRLLARTETMAAVNQASLSRYQKAGVSQIQWIAGADDGRTCEECLSLDGQVFDISEVPDIPVHPNCRCTTAPVGD